VYIQYRPGAPGARLVRRLRPSGRGPARVHEYWAGVRRPGRACAGGAGPGRGPGGRMISCSAKSWNGARRVPLARPEGSGARSFFFWVRLLQNDAFHRPTGVFRMCTPANGGRQGRISAAVPRSPHPPARRQHARRSFHLPPTMRACLTRGRIGSCGPILKEVRQNRTTIRRTVDWRPLLPYSSAPSREAGPGDSSMTGLFA